MVGALCRVRSNPHMGYIKNINKSFKNLRPVNGQAAHSMHVRAETEQ